MRTGVHVLGASSLGRSLSLPETRDRLLSYVSEAPAESSDGLKEVSLFVSVGDAFCPKSLKMREKRDLKPTL